MERLSGDPQALEFFRRNLTSKGTDLLDREILDYRNQQIVIDVEPTQSPEIDQVVLDNQNNSSQVNVEQIPKTTETQEDFDKSISVLITKKLKSIVQDNISKNMEFWMGDSLPATSLRGIFKGKAEKISLVDLKNLCKVVEVFPEEVQPILVDLYNGIKALEQEYKTKLEEQQISLEIQAIKIEIQSYQARFESQIARLEKLQNRRN